MGSSVPHGWTIKQIGEIAKIVGGGTPSTSDPSNFEDGKISWITPKDLSGYVFRRISRGERNITDKGLATSSAKLVPAGRVLLTTRAPIGYVAIADKPLATNQGFRSLVLKNGYDSEFIFYLLKTQTETLKANAGGTTYGELAGSTLKQIEVLLPPLSEQNRIAEILGALDDKIELNMRMNKTLEAMAAAIFKSWFIDFEPFQDSEFIDSELGPIPKGWEVNTIERIAKVASGKRPPQVLEVPIAEPPIPIYGGAGPMGYAMEPLFDEQIIVTGRVGTLGKVHRVPQPSWPSDNTLVVLVTEKSFYEFLFSYMQCFSLETLNRGTSNPLITQRDIKRQKIVIPPREIAQRFSEVCKQLFDLVDENMCESRALAQIRDTLLPKLLSGEIRARGAKKFMEEAI